PRHVVNVQLHPSTATTFAPDLGDAFQPRQACGPMKWNFDGLIQRVSDGYGRAAGIVLSRQHQRNKKNKHTRADLLCLNHKLTPAKMVDIDSSETSESLMPGSSPIVAEARFKWQGDRYCKLEN